MAASFMPLHVTPDTERLPTSRMRTLERLLTRVRMAVDLQAAGSAESLVAGLTDVAIL